MADINSNYWAATFIDDLVARGIVDGYLQPDGTYKYLPGNDITRAELMKLLAAALGLDLINNYDGSAFADWGEVTDWAKPYVAALVEAKIVYGSLQAGELYINADKKIIREEMIAMAVRALGVDPSGSVASAPDIIDVSDWAADDVAFAVNNKMINTHSGGNINPKVNAKRDETAMIISKLLEFLEL